MRVARRVNVLALLVLWAGFAQCVVYYPPTCAQLCGEGDFIPKLPLEHGPVADAENGAYAWAVEALIQTKLNFANLSPPAVGRVTAVVGSCLYEAAALSEEYYGTSLDYSFKFPEAGNADVIRHTLDGAGFWAVYTIFGQSEYFPRVLKHYTAFSGRDIEDLIPAMEAAAKLPLTDVEASIGYYSIDRPTAVAAGAAVCQRVIEKYTADGFTASGALRDGYDDPTHYHPVNIPQYLAGITDCDNEMLDMNRWQPLCIPHTPYDFGTPNCDPQEFLYPWAGRYTPFAIGHGDEDTGYGLVDPPPSFGTYEYQEQWEEVLEYSASLNDAQKIIAEYWADGPDTTMPAGHLWKIAADAAYDRGLSASETARLLFIVGNAVYDAGIASWRTKTSYDFIRPLQMIQCEARNEIRHAWQGPYQGVGYMNISEWRPYQAADFVTPPFAAYTSGHSTFSAAASEALRLFFEDDAYVGPFCDVVLEGESLFEPYSEDYPGLSDHPNSGPFSTGYVPADDVVLCWETFTDASDQSGISRLYGGIHIKADDDSGQELGRSVGRAVFKKANDLYAPFY